MLSGDYVGFGNQKDEVGTACPRISDPFSIATYHIKWVTTSWTDGTACPNSLVPYYIVSYNNINGSKLFGTSSTFERPKEL